MTVHLASVPVCDDQLDLLSAIADTVTPLGKLHAEDFEQACRAVATNDGWVNPNLVSAWLHARWGDYSPNWYSAMWAPACGPNGFMDTHEDFQVPIDGKHSRGNQNKTVAMRRLRSAA